MLPQGLLDLLALGDIAHSCMSVAIGRARRGGLAVSFDDDAPTVLTQHRVFNDALACAPDIFRNTFAVFRDDQLLDEPAHQFLDRIARHARELFVTVQDAAALADDDALESGGRKQRQAFFALAQGLFVA